MILVRAPLRISFVGGGTDLPDFYRRSPGRVISATIDKFIYLAIKPTSLVNKFIVKYQKTEMVSHPRELEHDRVREALLDMNIVKGGIEVGSFADLPAKTGLGSSSSFSVALMKGLNAFSGKKLNKIEAAELACNLEINLLKEPIGKQDQYASSFGGFNIFQFNKDGSVDIEPILLDYQKRSLLENHLLLFFTGINRAASSVLTEQRSKIAEHFETYKKMADLVPDFKKALMDGNIKGMADLLNEGWQYKKGLASNITNSLIDNLFDAGINAGAWGGKILGAGGGGCLLFLAPLDKRDGIKELVKKSAIQNNLSDFQEIPVRFNQSGTDIIFNDHHDFIS